MTDIEVEEEQAPVAHVTVVYTGPAAPHWDLRVRYGDQKLVDDFWARVTARLLLLPKHDPQFRRNRERVNRDAERELIVCDWDLGDEEDNNSGGHRAGRSSNGQAPAAAAVEAPVEEPQDEVVAGETDTPSEEPVVDDAGDGETATDETPSDADVDAGPADSTDSEDSAEPASSEEE